MDCSPPAWTPVLSDQILKFAHNDQNSEDHVQTDRRSYNIDVIFRALAHYRFWII